MSDGIIPRVRVIDLETAGNGLSDVCEIGWQDVEQGGGWHLGACGRARCEIRQSR